MEHLNGVICGSTTRSRFIRNNTRQSETPRIDSIMACIIVAQELAGNFRYAIECRWPLYRNLRCLLTWRTWTERSYRAREEYSASILSRSLKDVVQAAHIEPPRGLRFSFGSGGQDCREVVDRSNFVPVDSIQDCVGIGAIEPFVSDLIGCATRWSL